MIFGHASSATQNQPIAFKWQAERHFVLIVEEMGLPRDRRSNEESGNNALTIESPLHESWAS